MVGLKKFTCLDDIPEFPRYKSLEEYQQLIKRFIDAGAISKKDLVFGWYIGQSRSTNIARWVGSEFIFIRNKMGSRYIDSINHFEDDDDYDLFIPFKFIIEA